MAALREQDFDKMATDVVDQFLSGKADLADAAAKTASARGLNPDQIERLVQSANTMTFLRMMDRRKEAGERDLMHEFDPIDAAHVIRIVIDDAGVHVMPGGHKDSSGVKATEAEKHDDEMELPNEMNPAEGELGHKDTPKVEACEEECHEDLDPPHIVTKKKEAMAQRARKLTGILEDQYKQAEWAYEERFAALCDRFKRVYNNVTYDEFEKDAMAEYGDVAGLTIIDSLRQARKLAPLGLDSGLQKVAALNDHHVSIESPELHLFEELHTIATKAAQLERGIVWVKSQCA